MKKLPLCCTKPDCKQFQRTVELMKIWGVNDEPQADGRRYFFDVAIPPFWSAYRRERFAEVLRTWPTGHELAKPIHRLWGL
jgi:hypothetical protein